MGYSSGFEIMEYCQKVMGQDVPLGEILNVEEIVQVVLRHWILAVQRQSERLTSMR